MLLKICAATVILKECKALAQAVGQQAKEIDGKVCKKKIWKQGSSNASKTGPVDDGRWSCVDYAKDVNTTYNTLGDVAEGRGFSWRFGDVKDSDARADKSVSTDAAGHTNRGWPGTTSAGTETADGMADDLSKSITRDERNKVAGLLSKTISGAEVVEIRAVSTTSVMLNACYDL